MGNNERYEDAAGKESHQREAQMTNTEAVTGWQALVVSP